MYFWTEQQDSIIRKHFPNNDLDLISKETGKTIDAIKSRAKRLKIYVLPKINIRYKKIPLHIRIYLAGHFDGEGCARFRKKDTRLTRVPEIAVSICNLQTLIVYQKYFNGKIRVSQKGTNKVIHTWTCRKYEDVYNFILSVIPYSIEKREQLLLLKKFIDLRQQERKTISFSNDFIEIAKELNIKCTQLKRI